MSSTEVFVAVKCLCWLTALRRVWYTSMKAGEVVLTRLAFWVQAGHLYSGMDSMAKVGVNKANVLPCMMGSLHRVTRTAKSCVEMIYIIIFCHYMFNIYLIYIRLNCWVNSLDNISSVRWTSSKCSDLTPKVTCSRVHKPETKKMLLMRRPWVRLSCCRQSFSERMRGRAMMAPNAVR